MDTSNSAAGSQFVAYSVRLWHGEVVELRLLPGGRSVCPVCGHIASGWPPYSYGEFGEDGLLDSARPKDKWATGSMDICPSCQTQYGLCDFQPDRPRFTQVQLWSKLRTLWLDRENWSPAALDQLRENLGITEALARHEAEELRDVPLK